MELAEGELASLLEAAWVGVVGGSNASHASWRDRESFVLCRLCRLRRQRMYVLELEGDAGKLPWLHSSARGAPPTRHRVKANHVVKRLRCNQQSSTKHSSKCNPWSGGQVLRTRRASQAVLARVEECLPGLPTQALDRHLEACGSINITAGP